MTHLAIGRLSDLSTQRSPSLDVVTDGQNVARPALLAPVMRLTLGLHRVLASLGNSSLPGRSH